MSQSWFYQEVTYFYKFSIETAAFDTWSYVQINAALISPWNIKFVLIKQLFFQNGISQALQPLFTFSFFTLTT